MSETLKALCDDFIIKKIPKTVLCYHLPCVFKIFIDVFAFLSEKSNSKEICEEMAFPSFFRKMLMSAFLFVVINTQQNTAETTYNLRFYVKK